MSDGIIVRLLEEDVQALLEASLVSLAFVFGSRARGDPDERSDLDVAVLFPGRMEAIPRVEEADRLRGRLQALVGIAVDVVVLNDVGPLVRSRAVVAGLPILRCDPGLLFRYEQKVRRDHEDFVASQRYYVRELRRAAGLAA